MSPLPVLLSLSPTLYHLADSFRQRSRPSLPYRRFFSSIHTGLLSLSLSVRQVKLKAPLLCVSMPGMEFLSSIRPFFIDQFCSCHATDFLTALGRGRVGLTGRAYVSFSTHSSYKSSASSPARPSSEVRHTQNRGANSAGLWAADYPLRVPDLLVSIQTPFVPTQTRRLPLGRVFSSSFDFPRCLGRALIMTRCVIYLRPVVHAFLHDFAASGRTQQRCTVARELWQRQFFHPIQSF